MKKYILRICLFFAIILLLDTVFGYACRYLNTHAKGGFTQNHYHIAEELTDSVLIFGSSRAVHHFNPVIIEDSLGTTVYNCGVDGNGIIFSYGRLLTILQRYTPKMIIYDVIPSFDMEKDDYTKYLEWQKRWYDKPGVAEIFHDLYPLEKYKMLSNLYRYNTSFIQMLTDNLKPQKQFSFKGYLPIEEHMSYNVEEYDGQAVQWSPEKLKYFKLFADLCKQNDIELVFSFSPWYKAKNSRIYDEFLEFSHENGIPVIDMFADPYISTNPEYFADASHLNSEGADVFTSKFCKELSALNQR